MPPLARNLIDPAAAAAIQQWVAAMPALGALPAGWISEDIGAVGQGGDAAFANGVYSLVGSGADIWDNADGFQFVHQPLHGDGKIIARVAAVGDTDGWAKAGVMIRETTAPDSRQAMAMITHDQGAAFQRRTTAGGASDHTPGPAVHAPYWVMLERKGNIFTGSVSADGKTWQKIDQATIPMNTDVQCGMAITAHNGGAACPAVFDHVTVERTN
jgi:regulation of enolase protein 1 (concanavalin A-like superfamily)